MYGITYSLLLNILGIFLQILNIVLIIFKRVCNRLIPILFTGNLFIAGKR
jgi:hypothetical protein